MGQIQYGQVPQDSQQPRSGSGVEFFFLRDDGDEAIVRIMHDSPATFDIVAVHPYEINGRTRNVNCIRNPNEDVEKCPFCEEGIPLRYRFYVHLLVYKKDEQGNIVVVPSIWDRGLQYADMIKDFCAEYPPLSDYIFKIKRNGKKGSQDTTYNIIPANPNVYRNDLYPKVANAFDNFSVIGSMVYNLDYNGMQKALAPTEQEVFTPKEAPAAPVYKESVNPTGPYTRVVNQPVQYEVPKAPVTQQPYVAPPQYATAQVQTSIDPAVYGHTTMNTSVPAEPVARTYSFAEQQYVPPASYSAPVGHPDPVGEPGAPGVVRAAPQQQPESSPSEFVRPRRYA